VEEPTTPSELFAGSPDGLTLYRAIADLATSLGPVDVRVTKSQIALRRRTGFAYVWRPDRYLRTTVPAVLSLALPREVTSARWKEVAHPSSRVWMHHLELRDVADVDQEVAAWLHEAYAAAG
jgi:hypothetical protein